MTFLLLLLIALLSVLIFFYLSSEKERKKISLQATDLQENEQKLRELLKKEEASHKVVREKLQLFTKKQKKVEITSTIREAPPVKETLVNENFLLEKNELSRKIDHLEEQVEALTQQLKEKNQESKNLKESLYLETQNAEKNLEKSMLKLRKEQGKLKEKAQEQKKNNNKAILEMKLEKQSLEQKTELELKKLKQKLRHYQQFYAMSMNQKQMLEDKIKNWEKALKILSAWILKKDQKNATMGELVAGALEYIGSGSLVEDEFNFKPLEKPKFSPEESLHKENHA
jgi:hypothetical protein